jgi:hypothetical protein
MIKKRTGIKRTTNGETLEELARELRHMRCLVREIGENFILRREGELETVISNLDDVPPAKLRAVASSLLQDIRGLKIKSSKGRLKDLKGLNGLIAEMADRVLSAQDRGTGTAKGRQGDAG